MIDEIESRHLGFSSSTLAPAHPPEEILDRLEGSLGFASTSARVVGLVFAGGWGVVACSSSTYGSTKGRDRRVSFRMEEWEEENTRYGKR